MYVNSNMCYISFVAVADMEILNKIYDHYPPEEAFQKVPPPPYPIETHPLLWTQWVNENVGDKNFVMTFQFLFLFFPLFEYSHNFSQYMRGFGLMATSLEYVHCQYHELDDKLEKAEQRIKDLEGQLKLAMKERDDAKLRELEANTANEALQAERDYLAQKLDAVTNYFAK